MYSSDRTENNLDQHAPKAEVVAMLKTYEDKARAGPGEGHTAPLVTVTFKPMI